MKKSCKTCEFKDTSPIEDPCAMCYKYSHYCWKHTVLAVTIFLVVLLVSILSFAYWWGCRI